MKRLDIHIIMFSTLLVLSCSLLYAVQTPTYDTTKYHVEEVEDMGEHYNIVAGKMIESSGGMKGVNMKIEKESFDFTPEPGQYIEIQRKSMLNRRSIVSITKINYTDDVLSLRTMD